MIVPLLDLVRSVFPAADPRSVRAVAEDLKKRGFSPKDLYEPNPIDVDPFQADVVVDLALTVAGPDGSLSKRTGPSLILTNSCDLVREDHAVFAACFPARRFADRNPEWAKDLRNNLITNFLYLPATELGDLVVDFAIVGTVDRGYLAKGLRSGSVRRVVRLSQAGWYIFLLKLMIHMSRPEPSDVVRLEMAEGPHGSAA